MVNSAEEVDYITDLANQITVAVLHAKWKLCTIINRYKGREMVSKEVTIGERN